MSLSLYNPDLVATEDLIRLFVARRDVLAELVEDLGAERPQHHLIVGLRGMGKTTLLRRLAAEIERVPTLAERWLALTFPEEQYNVGRLSDLWLNCLDALADALERRGDEEESKKIDAFIHGLPDDEERRAARALDGLLAHTRAGRGLVLLVDNVDQLLGRLTAHHWELRELLGGEERLVFVGASSAMLDAAFEYKEAFYDFFHVHWLRGLDLAAMKDVLRASAAASGQTAVIEQVLAHAGRVRALHVLTGGNPRTVVMLYQVLARDPGGDVRRQLEALLDLATPLYKARFEALPNQAQLVLDALATGWDPLTAAEVAERARIEVNAASTQLHRLHQEGVVEKVELPEATRQGFQVAERFFNVWYLMRASRRLRQRLLSLARCLEALYDIEDLRALAGQVLKDGKEADFALIVSRLAPDEGLRRALEMKALDQAMSRPEDWDELKAALGKEFPGVMELAGRREALAKLAEMPAVDWRKLGFDPEIAEVVEAGAGLPGAVRALALFLSGEVEVMHVGVEPAALDLARTSLEAWLRQRTTPFGDLKAAIGPRLWAKLRSAMLAGDVNLALQPKDLLGVALRDGDEEFELFARAEAMLSGASPFDGALAHRMDRSREGHTRFLWTGFVNEEARRRASVLTASEPETMLDNLLRARVEASRGNAAAADRYHVRAWELGSRDVLVAVRMSLVSRHHEEAAGILLGLSLPPKILRGLATLWSDGFPDSALRAWARVAAASDPLEPLDDLLKLCRGLIRADRAPDALALVDTDTLRDRARPLFAALSAVVAQDAKQLGRFAPEVAGPARDLLDALWPEPERPPSSSPRRRGRPRAR